MSQPVLSPTLIDGIHIRATAGFSPGDSEPADRNYVFRYTIEIINEGESPAQLISRRWIIIDGNGNREEVSGPGVIGQTPRLLPGESFKYESFCQLKTSWGTMEGTYQMKRDDDEIFDAIIPRFFLKID